MSNHRPSLVLALMARCWASPAAAEWPFAFPTINPGGVISSCYTNSVPQTSCSSGLPGHTAADGICKPCDSSRLPTGELKTTDLFWTILGEQIEIYGSNLTKGNTLSGVKFTQYHEGYYAPFTASVMHLGPTGISYVTDTQVNVLVPTGKSLRSGPTFVSLMYTDSSESNAEVINIIGPRIYGDGIQAANIWIRNDLSPGTTVDLWGEFPCSTGVTFRCQIPPAGQQPTPTTPWFATSAPIVPSWCGTGQLHVQMPTTIQGHALVADSICAVTLNDQMGESQPWQIRINTGYSANYAYKNGTGVYMWRNDAPRFYPDDTMHSSSLLAMAKRAEVDGFGTFRFYLGPEADCNCPNPKGTPSLGGTYNHTTCSQTYTTLKGLATRDDFDYVIRQSQFSTIIITAYPYQDTGWWWNPAKPNNSLNEAAELSELASYLVANNLTNKRIIIDNWESDSALYFAMQVPATLSNGQSSNLSDTRFWDDQVAALVLRYRDWAFNRAHAVNMVRIGNGTVANPQYSKLGSAFDLGRTWPGIMEQPTVVYMANSPPHGCSATPYSMTVRISAARDVLPAIKDELQFVSWSMYGFVFDAASGRTSFEQPPLKLGSTTDRCPRVAQDRPQSRALFWDTAANVQLGLNFVRNIAPNVQPIVGEYGFTDHQFDAGVSSFEGQNYGYAENRAIRRVLNAAVGSNAAAAVLWQMGDNVETGDPGFGLVCGSQPKLLPYCWGPYARKFAGYGDTECVLQRHVLSVGTANPQCPNVSYTP